ncbi:hypothetical protein P8452_16973 [Trifolium repens]|nr:hypothetical protein P8452_16973 [Trifolium repens]
MTQLDRSLLKRAVKLSLDDLKAKHSGDFLSSRAVQIRNHAPDLAQTIAGLILSSSDLDFQRECFSILKSNSLELLSHFICRKRFLTDGEFQIAETYVLVNCKEVEPFLQQFEDSLRQSYLGITDDQILELRDRDFSQWIKQQVSSGQVKYQLIRQMSYAESFNDEQLDLNELVASDYYQDDGSFGTNNVVIEDEEVSLFDANSPMEESKVFLEAGIQ